VNVLDSSGWLEYFADGPNAANFTTPLTELDRLLVPSITLYEVYKSMLRQRGKQMAVEAIAAMKRGRVLPLDEPLALKAAATSLELKLPMADSIIYATARKHDALLWTQDVDFQGLSGVRYYPKPVG